MWGGGGCLLSQVQTDLLDVNKNIFDEMERHTKAMSAIYAHRHSETSSSDLNSGVSTPDTDRGTGGLGLGEWDPDTEGSDIKDVRTSLTTGTPLADEGGGDERVSAGGRREGLAGRGLTVRDGVVGGCCVMVARATTFWSRRGSRSPSSSRRRCSCCWSGRAAEAMDGGRGAWGGTKG